MSAVVTFGQRLAAIGARFELENAQSKAELKRHEDMMIMRSMPPLPDWIYFKRQAITYFDGTRCKWRSGLALRITALCVIMGMAIIRRNGVLNEGFY